jgi:hypothetical protein
MLNATLTVTLTHCILVGPCGLLNYLMFIPDYEADLGHDVYCYSKEIECNEKQPRRRRRR